MLTKLKFSWSWQPQLSYFCHWPGWPWCFMPGQSGLWPGSTRFSSPALAPVCHGQARPGWPPAHGFPGFFIPWPARPKPGLWPGSPRLSPVYAGLARLLMQGVLSHIYSIISVFFSLPLLRDLLRYSLCLVYARDFSSLFYWTALLAYIMVCTSGTR